MKNKKADEEYVNFRFMYLQIKRECLCSGPIRLPKTAYTRSHMRSSSLRSGQKARQPS